MSKFGECCLSGHMLDKTQNGVPHRDICPQTIDPSKNLPKILLLPGFSALRIYDLKIQISLGSVAIGRQEHAYMETHSALVIPIGEKDEFVCYYTTQEPTTVQTNISKVLGVPKHKIIVKTKRTGGGFGGKERLHTALVIFKHFSE